MNNILEVENLNVHYKKFHAVKDINLSLKQKDIFVVCGPSGSGKSTLIRAIAYSYTQLTLPTNRDV